MSKKHKRHAEHPSSGQIELRPGNHVIDGVDVVVPAEPGTDHVWYPLPVGNHIIDQVMVHVDEGLPVSVAAEPDDTV